MQPNQRSGLMIGVATAGGLAALVATFFLAGEDHYPGRFFIERQAYWNGGTYYMKFTFLSVLFTLVDLIAIPVMLFSGIAALVASREGQAEPPLDWDTSQTGRRFKHAAFVLLGTVVWLAYTGAAIFAPGLLAPAGFLASLFLLFIPIVPLGLVAFAFEALASPQYVEGILESVQVVKNKNENAIAHLRVGGADFTTQPSVVAGLAQGARVGLIVSGYFKSILRIERRG